MQAFELFLRRTGLRVLLLAAKKLDECGGRLALCSLTPAVQQVFELAGFTAIFALEPSRDDALARLSAPR